MSELRLNVHEIALWLSLECSSDSENRRNTNTNGQTDRRTEAQTFAFLQLLLKNYENTHLVVLVQDVHQPPDGAQMDHPHKLQSLEKRKLF